MKLSVSESVSASQNFWVFYPLTFNDWWLWMQVLSKDDPPRKAFVYKLDTPVSARWISLVVAPFQILPDYHSSLLSHMCLPGSLSKLQYTVGFFYSAFRFFFLSQSKSYSRISLLLSPCFGGGMTMLRHISSNLGHCLLSYYVSFGE